jgi:pimeloyl-ACP methyl ester carboxylesterase
METTIRSADGTPITYLTFGTGPAGARVLRAVRRTRGRERHGPGLVIVPGATRRAYHYAALATTLGHSRTVHVIDRRGRGTSGPQGPGYTIDREVEDVRAVLDATGADAVFGHSYGGLVALETARVRPLSTLIVYEPAVSLNGGFNQGFLPLFTRAIARGRYATAMARLMVGLNIAPARLPAAALVPLGWLMMRGREGAVLRETLRTVPAEISEEHRLDSDGRRYATITAPTLLLGGGRSPGWLRSVVSELHQIIPNSSQVVCARLDHNAPDQNAPEAIAGLVRAFLAPAESIP